MDAPQEREREPVIGPDGKPVIDKDGKPKVKEVEGKPLSPQASTWISTVDTLPGKASAVDAKLETAEGPDLEAARNKLASLRQETATAIGILSREAQVVDSKYRKRVNDALTDAVLLQRELNNMG